MGLSQTSLDMDHLNGRTGDNSPYSPPGTTGVIEKLRIEAEEKRGHKLVDSRKKVEVPPFRQNVPAERMSPRSRGS